MGKWLCGLAVFVCAVAPFARSARYGVVNCDDYSYVATYGEVMGGVTARGAGWAFTFKDEGIWMPLTWLSYMADWSLGGGDEGRTYRTMHVHSVLLHGVNAVLAWLLLWRLAGGGAALAAVAALLWAMHPLRTESVAWIASRKDVLSMMWLLLALLFWDRRREGRVLSWQYLASMVCFALGAMAKPSVMCFPALAVLADWMKGRLAFAGKSPGELVRMALLYVPPVALAGAVAYLAWWMQTAGGCTVEFSDMPAWARLLNAAVSFGAYLVNTVWPTGLAPQCLMRWPGTPRMMVAGLAAAAGFAWAFWRLAERVMREQGTGNGERGMAAGLAWYAVAVLPFLGVSSFGYHALADRFTYIPAVGLSLAAMGLAQRFAEGRRRTCVALGAVALVALGALSWRQTEIWSSDKAMWEQTIRVDGERNGVAEAGLGLWHFEFDHGSPAAEEHFDRAFESSPDYMQKTGFIYIGHLAERGKMAKATERLKWYSEWSQAMRDAERRAMGLDDIVEMKPMMQYRMARVAYFTHDPELRGIGEKELEELEALRPDDIHIAYLRGMMEIVKGNAAGAEKAWARIKALARPKDCVRYRFFGELAERAGGRRS